MTDTRFGGAPGALRVALLLGTGAVAGWLFQRLGSPLPWMIGPLVATALLSASGRVAVSVPDRIRPFGQIVVASQVGLTFSPDAAATLTAQAPAILATALATLIGIVGVSIAFARWNGMSYAQSFLASVPTSPVEAAEMTAARGLDPMPVIFLHTLRMSAVVVLLPFALFAVEGWPASRTMPYADQPFRVADIALLLAIGFAAMHLFRRLRVPNPNFLGPLAAMAALAVSGHGLAPYPAAILSAAQVVLGCWLGSTFRRDRMARAGRLAATGSATILALLSLCSALAVAIALAAGLDWRIVLLGAAPGGVTEMALTAKVLQRDATTVTAFHLTRIFLFMPSIPWIVALIARLDRPAPNAGDPP